MLKRTLQVIAFILIIVGIFVVRLLYNSGFFKQIENHDAGKITEIRGLTGAEDITIDDETGFAYISADDRRNKENKGDIFVIDLKENKPHLINLTKDSPLQDFHPHGISLLKLPNGDKQLYVINHRETTGNVVEIFSLKDSVIEHLESIYDDLFLNPNDILAVGEKQFYVTNDHDEPLRKSRRMKDLMQIPMGNVVYHDGKAAKIVAKDLLYANGVNKSVKGDKIFVAETTNRKIRVYDRNTSNGTLSEVDEIKIDGPDNIEVLPDGSLWVGCHPKLLAYLNHAKEHSTPSPSQIVKITYKPNSESVIEEVFMNDGKKISGSSVGTTWKNKLLIGTVFEPKILLIEK